MKIYYLHSLTIFLIKKFTLNANFSQTQIKPQNNLQTCHKLHSPQETNHFPSLQNKSEFYGQFFQSSHNFSVALHQFLCSRKVSMHYAKCIYTSYLVYSPNSIDKKSKIKFSKESKAKPDTYKKHASDQDKLRNKVQINGTEKERSTDTMDSLDYEAITCASVKNISNKLI